MTGLRSGVRRRCVRRILEVARRAAVWHLEGGEVITIQNAKALYYRDTLQWCKAVLHEIEELTYCVFISFFICQLCTVQLQVASVAYSSRVMCCVIIFLFLSCSTFFLIVALNGASDRSNILYFRDTWKLLRLHLEYCIPVIEGERPSFEMLQKCVRENGW